MNDKSKVLLIVNPCAGKNKTRAGTFDIVDRFSSEDYDFTVKTTTGPGDATDIVLKNAEGHDMVVCCGGDGTLYETINGVMDMPRRVPIGYEAVLEKDRLPQRTAEERIYLRTFS